MVSRHAVALSHRFSVTSRMAEPAADVAPAGERQKTPGPDARRKLSL